MAKFILMLYPQTTQPFDDLLTMSGRYAFRTWRQIFLLILMFVGLKSLYTHLPMMPWWAGDIIELLIVAIAIFLWLLAIYRVDALLSEIPRSWRQALQMALHRLGIIYLGVILIILAMAAIVVLGWIVVFQIFKLNAALAALAMIFIAGLPLILLLMYGYVLIFTLALTELPLWMAFYRSLWSLRQYFLPLIVIYTEVVVLLVISYTHTRHGQWLLDHHLMELTDLVAASIIVPLVLNLTLLLWHDIQLSLSRD